MASMEKTLSPSNRFSFTCPLFGAAVELRGCLALRDKVWRGERVEIRQGCQACMRASKCPIVPMMQTMMREKGDPYYSAEPRLGGLGGDLLKRIANVVVPDSILKLFDIPQRQRDLILETNGQLGAKKLKGISNLEEVEFSAPSESHRESAPRKSKAEKIVEPDALLVAAATGDLSAAINVAI